MRILGIETSCDETAAAVIEANKHSPNVNLLSNIVASSLVLHSKTGGIIPETAAREQIKYIIPVIEKALADSQSSPSSLDAIAVTVGPGLIGSLLVGIETAKTLAYVWNKPIVPVNHLIGHIYANWIMENGNWKMANILFPAVALIVSGGHTDLVLMRDHGDLKWLGGTRDDAAGEALDKIGRLLGLSYPAGPTIEKLAKEGNSKKFNFPRPMIDSNNFDFSFSGLKTSVSRHVILRQKAEGSDIVNIAAGVQQSIIDVLVKKTLNATLQYNAKSILLGGGVSANEKLRAQLIQNTKYLIPDTEIFFPKKFLCTDNGAMIASAAFFNYKEVPFQQITADPELYFN